MDAEHLIRFDLLPAYTVMNPMFCGTFDAVEPEEFKPLTIKERVMWWIGRKLIEFSEE